MPFGVFVFMSPHQTDNDRTNGGRGFPRALDVTWTDVSFSVQILDLLRASSTRQSLGNDSDREEAESFVKLAPAILVSRDGGHTIDDFHAEFRRKVAPFIKHFGR